MNTKEATEKMRRYFETGITKEYEFRKAQLQKLKATVQKYEGEIFEALHKDLRKSKEESYISENGFVLSEASASIKNLKGWMDLQKVETNWFNFPSKSFIMAEPLGVVLIISPWNYPFNLLFTPLIGAIAAGNCVVVKPSEMAPATTAITKKIIEETFDPQYILFTEGDGATVVPELMDNFVFDHVFYTGSTAVGKIIYELAAKNLVPVTLELGGKSPCIIESDADVKIAAKRITMTKFLNAGQTCVAPDYLLVHERVKEKLITAIIENIKRFFGDDAQKADFYGRIINEKQFDRIEKYLPYGKILSGGKTDKKDLYIEPTLLQISDTNNTVMQEEIFGPVLPIISFTNMEEAVNIIKQNKNPLAFYLFTSSKEKEINWLGAVAFGGGCINNAALHLVNDKLPFGGRGASGMGSYHGKFTFDTFSHKKSVMKTPTWFDPSIKYPPFTNLLNLFKNVMK
ncbi:MAG: aldehyde dehydrogenase [Ferruginibacter sp.]|nr:aldehyde dehydrogenase [Ferruginibacter sp.]